MISNEGKLNPKQTRVEQDARQTRVDSPSGASGGDGTVSGAAKNSGKIDPNRIFPNGFKGYAVEEHIGGGGEADVFRVRRGGEVRVLKVYKHAPSKPEQMREIIKLSQERSDCLVRIFESDDHQDLNNTGYVWYELQEYIPNGSLEDLIAGFGRDTAALQRFFTKDLIRNIIDQITTALEVLGKKNILHQDLKPPNILIRNRNPFEIVIADFGIATTLSNDGLSRYTANKGTLHYRSPEQFTSLASPATDFWALGIIVYELLMGRHPFKALHTDEEVLGRIMNGIPLPDMSERVDESFLLLLRGLLTGIKNHRQRWGCPQIRRWLNGERDIPEFFDGSGEESGIMPFPMDGKKFENLPSIIMHCANGPKEWQSGVEALRRDPSTLWTWLVKNNRLEEADRVDQIRKMPTMNNNEAFFNFVYTFNHELEFRYMGRPVTLNFLAESVQKENNNVADDVSHEIFTCLNDGTMERLCATYRRLTGNNAPFLGQLQNLFNVLKGKTAEEMLDTFVAVKRWQETHSSRKLAVIGAIAAALIALIAGGCWYWENYCMAVADAPSLLYYAATLGKIKVLDGQELNLFRFVHTASLTIFLVATIFIQRDKRRDWGSVAGSGFLPALPANLSLLSRRASKNQSYYRGLQYAAFIPLLIPLLTGIYLTTDDKIKSYAAAGNAKAEAFLKEKDKPPVSPPVTTPKLPFDAQVKKNSTDVNIRSRATTKSQSYGKVDGGFQLRVVEELSGESVNNSKLWFKVEYQTSSGGKNTGYMHSGFVERRGNAKATPPKAETKPPSPVSPKNTQDTANNGPKNNNATNDAKYQNLINEARQLQKAGRLDEAHKKYREAQLIPGKD
ncbi:MAG: protein kinase, partial [Synergistaceae bacterium]|nr:protein kinase [Synergistaceae bacterium]